MPKLHKTLTDYVVIAISPALIMTLIGSLVFFLIAVFYQGAFQGRLEYIMALFVFASVLVARIAIEEGRERAYLFAVALGLATLIVISRFVQFAGALGEYSFVLNAAFILLILWCADRLTWDCTVIDDAEDASGEGLLQTAGLDKPAEAGGPPAGLPEHEAAATTPRRPPPAGWWRWFVNRRRQPHAQGVWVVYFSLAALPLFGIGQRFLPGDLQVRRAAFWWLVVYVASGLGLLLTTSFLSLRRYVRQRNVEMPLDMVAGWLSLGAILIVALLVFCALLPRPSPEYSITQLSFQVGSPDNLRPSRHAPGQDGTAPLKPEPQAATVAKPSAKPAAADAGAQSGAKSDTKPEASERPETRPADQRPSPDKGSAGGSPDQKRGSSSAAQAGAKGETPPKGESPGKPSESAGQDKKPPTASSPAAGQDKRPPRESSPAAGQDKKPPSAPSATGSPGKPPPGTSGTPPSRPSEAPKESAPSRSQPPPGQPPPPSAAPPPSPSDSPGFSPLRMLNQLLGSVPYVLKGLYYLFFACLVGYLLWRFRTAVWTAVHDFLETLRSLWAHLFGGRPEAPGAPTAPATPVPPLPRFADFSDPFVTGKARQMPPDELIVYSFQALEAWAREQGCGRVPEQTPHELAAQLATAYPAVGAEAAGLADQYCWVAYAPEPVGRADGEQLQRLWHALRAAQRPPEPVAASSNSR